MKNDWQAQKNQTERDWLIEKHKPLVVRLTKEIAASLPFSLDAEELIAYGQLGLIEAGERFDSSRGNSFSTFAYYRIKGAIYDGLREMGVINRSQTLRFAAHANDVVTAEVDDYFHGNLTATPSEEIETIENLIDALIPIYFLSIDEPEVKELPDDSAFTATDFETRDISMKIRETLNEIEPDEADILRKLYFEDVSMTHLAKEMGVNKSWISRLHQRAIKHLQKALSKRGILPSDETSDLPEQFFES